MNKYGQLEIQKLLDQGDFSKCLVTTMWGYDFYDSMPVDVINDPSNADAPPHRERTVAAWLNENFLNMSRGTNVMSISFT